MSFKIFEGVIVNIDSDDDLKLNDKITAKHYCDLGGALLWRKSWTIVNLKSIAGNHL